MKQVEGSSECSDGANPCPICLSPVSQDAYLDRCFHKYCYSCIVRWMKVIASRPSRQAYSLKCPLCKTENFSVIYGYDGSTFQRQYVNQGTVNSTFYSEAHKYRLQCYYTDAGILNDTFNVTRYWKSGKYLQPNKWLQHWLKRDLQALTQEEDVDIIMHHILGVMDSFLKSEQRGQRRAPDLSQKEFKCLVANAAQPFLGRRTERFVDEVELFLASGLTMDAYDEVYTKHLRWKRQPEETSEDAEDRGSKHAATIPYLYLFNDSDEEAD
ncbi:hypothetical protein Nepgr_015012 [Nepenthes gracilis]|uniref:RING-type domain-containing protein n=1 Tax=Nepenthes gracilis TaxID=150966 RepID=A0AAD3XQX7_NEPGR|nr:hypothetical protein Nepgr_015012 [Nepenthes gracilis]